MISLIQIKKMTGYKLELHFSDGSYGALDFQDILHAKTVLTIPLEDKEYFSAFFIDFGALCWKNGLEFSAESLQLKLKEHELLIIRKDVA